MSSTVAHTFQAKQRTGDVLISENVDFKGLLLSERVLKGLKSAGFERPSPIQLKAIPLGRCGLDLIVQAKSGTGKTCVFSVIALENLQLDSTAFQAIVLAPTREIAVQIWDVINSIGQAIPSLKCHTFIGGMPLHEDKQKLKRCHIGVGTPGRIKQLIETGIMNVESVRMFILDEADKLLEESFQEQINWIYSTLPDNKQMLALSATYPEYLAQHLTAYMRNPTFLRLNITDPALLGIKQYFKMVPYHPMPNKVFEDKVKVVVELLSSVNFQQCLIFSNLQTRAHNMADTLTSMGWPTACIAGSHDQKDRNEAMAKLKTYKCRVLISTDLTSRGIDADKVNMVLNLDVPKDHETYLHRIGRAGRFGSFGAAITIISIGQEQTDLQAVEKKCNTHINPLPSVVPSDLCKSDVQIHLDDMVSSEQIITNGATQGNLLIPTKTKNTQLSPSSNIELNGTSEGGNNSELCIEETGKKTEKIQENGKLFEQVSDNSVVMGDNQENSKVLDKTDNDSYNGKKFISIKNRSSYMPSKSNILSKNGHISSNNEDGLTTVEQVDDKSQNTRLKQFHDTSEAGPENGLEVKENHSHNNCSSLVSESEADEGSVINDVHKNVKSKESSARNIDVTPSGTTCVKKSVSGANESVYRGLNGSIVHDDSSKIASYGPKVPAHVYSSHSSIFDSNQKIPFSVKLPSYREVIAHQKVLNPHTFETAVQEFQEQNKTKDSIPDIKSKILRPVDAGKIQRKEVFSEISTFLQQVSENENARYHVLNLKNTHLEKKKIETAGNENSGQKLSTMSTFEQIWEKLGDVPENANFTAVKVVPIKLSNEQKTASSVNNNPLFECSIRTGQISCKASNKESKVISENIPSNMALHMAKDLEGNCEEKENDIFGMSKSMLKFWDQLGENVESTEDKTSSSVSDFELKNGQLVCKNIKIAPENSNNNNNKMVDTVRIGDDKENSYRKPNLGPSKSNQRKRYRPLSLGAFCNNMRENNEQSDSFSTQVQELACSKSVSDSVQLDKVNDIKHLDDPDDNFKHLEDSDDDTSESILSSSCSEISDSEDSSSTSDEEEDCLDKHAHTSEGRSQNNHMKSQSRHNRTTPSPVFNYQHGYDPYWYGCAQPHYGWLPWYSYQNPYYYPTHLSRQQQYSKLQENLDTQSEYIALMLKK